MPHQTSEPPDITLLDDTALFDERRRVRELLEHLPEHHADRAVLASLHENLTGEFDRRARAQWTAAS